MMASVCTATRTMPVAADIMEHFARIETIFQCIKRKTIFRLTQNTKQVKHLLIVGPSIVACHAANNCVIAARMHGCSCSRTAFSMLNRSASPHACAPRSFWAKDPHPTATKKLLINKSLKRFSFLRIPKKRHSRTAILRAASHALEDLSRTARDPARQSALPHGRCRTGGMHRMVMAG